LKNDSHYLLFREKWLLPRPRCAASFIFAIQVSRARDHRGAKRLPFVATAGGPTPVEWPASDVAQRTRVEQIDGGGSHSTSLVD
jgi:hypothetical protein